MLKLKKPKSFLRYGKNMTVGELKNVSERDVMIYQTEWMADIAPAIDEDKSSVQETNQKMTALAIEVYGEQSKQHKYLYRNFNKGESVVDIHYRQYPQPDELKWWVENSKTNRYNDACVPARNYEQKGDNE